METIKRQATSQNHMTRIERVFDSKFGDYTLKLFVDGFNSVLTIEHLSKLDCDEKFDKVVMYLDDVDKIKTFEVK